MLSGDVHFPELRTPDGIKKHTVSQDELRLCGGGGGGEREGENERGTESGGRSLL